MADGAGDDGGRGAGLCSTDRDLEPAEIQERQNRLAKLAGPEKGKNGDIRAEVKQRKLAVTRLRHM